METDATLQIPEVIARQGPSECDWASLAHVLAPHYAGGLFTILEVDVVQRLVRRAYSSNPASYAPGGTKQLLGTSWARQVIEDGRCLIASTPEHMEAAFADHRTLYELGCTTAMNIPLHQGCDVAWTVNLLRGGVVYTPAESLVVKSNIRQWMGELRSHSTPPRSP